MENNSESSAAAELIKRGILVPRTYCNTLTSESCIAYVLSDSFQDSFLDFIYPIIESNVKAGVDFSYQVEMNRINLFPESQKAALIVDAISKYVPDVDLVFLDSVSEKAMILDFYNYQELLQFDNGEKFNVLNKHLGELIREKRILQVLKLLKLEATSHKPQRQQKQKTSYLWLINPDAELPKLYNLMVNKYRLIAPETTCEQIRAVFTGQAIDEIEPIKWHQNNASELLYFIIKLQETDTIAKKSDYQKMTACFVKPDGNQFVANWKQIKQNIDINLAVNKQNAIDELVENL